MSESYPCLEALDKEFTLRKQHDGTRLGGIGRVAACEEGVSARGASGQREWAWRHRQVPPASQRAVFLALSRTHGMF